MSGTYSATGATGTMGAGGAANVPISNGNNGLNSAPGPAGQPGPSGPPGMTGTGGPSSLGMTGSSGPSGSTPQTTFTQVNLVSDGSVPALNTDPNLINPWGIADSPTSPFWISDNGTGLAEIDAVNGQTVKLNGIPPVTIAPPSPGAGPAAPTGQVWNPFASSGAFTLSDGSPATFLFATEDGTISGWNSGAGTQSIIAVNESQNPADGSEALGQGAVYKGLTIANTQDGPMLYAANFRHGTVDVYDQNFNMVNSFTDPTVPAGFAPFNVQVLDNKLFVTFAQQDDQKHDDVAGPGNGFVDEFSLSGQMLARVDSGGPLNSPWGLAIAPPSFGSFAGDLLVGNFGDGTINAFDPNNFTFEGKLTGSDGQPIVDQDLWSLTPGNGGSAGDPNTLFFTAGLQNEQGGLFGALMPNSPGMSGSAGAAGPSGPAGSTGSGAPPTGQGSGSGTPGPTGPAGPPGPAGQLGIGETGPAVSSAGPTTGIAGATGTSASPAGAAAGSTPVGSGAMGAANGASGAAGGAMVTSGTTGAAAGGQGTAGSTGPAGSSAGMPTSQTMINPSTLSPGTPSSQMSFVASEVQALDNISSVLASQGASLQNGLGPVLADIVQLSKDILAAFPDPTTQSGGSALQAVPPDPNSGSPSLLNHGQSGSTNGVLIPPGS